MRNILREIMVDLNFIRSHTLQPKWYKVFKVFLLIGMFAGYTFLFGIQKSLIFLGVFFFLALLLHFFYRAKTQRWTRSWMDFVVSKENSELKPSRIGVFYYAAIAFIFILAVVISQIN